MPHTNSTPVPSIDLEMSQRVPTEEDEKMNNHTTDLNLTIIDPEELKKNSDSPVAWQVFMKNWPDLSQKFVLLLISILGWGIIYSIFPEHTYAGAPIIQLIFLFIGAEIVGELFLVIGLPDILGMLFWGVLFRNLGFATFDGLSGLEAFLREMTLVNIMLLAGLGLDLQALKKCLGIVIRLTLIPSLVEVSCITVLSVLLLKMPWLWSMLLG